MQYPASSSDAAVAGPHSNRRALKAEGQIRLRSAAVRFGPHLVTAVVVFIFGLPTLIFPFWSDHAIFATIGRAIAEGHFPYVDAWDQKPPAIYLIFAAAIQGP